MKLRGFQVEGQQAIFDAWAAGNVNVLFTLPTGGGKTVTLADIIRLHMGASCVIAHRSELVAQISLALARQGVRHRIIGPTNLVKFVVAEHMRELGFSAYDPSAQVAVASVKTIVNRAEQLKHWLPQVTLWVMDEAHHILRSNQWGQAVTMFPHARGLGVTATPGRADGHGLGRTAKGVFDTIVQGPSMRWLIDEGYLTDYRIFCPPNDIDMSQIKISETTGEMTAPTVKKAVRASHIVGDVVAHYQRIASGCLNVVFGSDVDTASDFAVAFNKAGVRAEVITGDTPDDRRVEILRRYRKGEIRVLSSVAIFDEGFDLPAIQVAQFARPTASRTVYLQQFGRALRPWYAPGFDLDTKAGRLASIAASPKPYAIILDHVNNVTRHGLPDQPWAWSLASKERRAKSDDDSIPLRVCIECSQPYERFRVACPYCGAVPEPPSRSAPAFVEGNLFELDAATLAQMRGAVQQVDDGPEAVAARMRYAGAPDVAVYGMMNQHRARQEMQQALRASIQWWAGWQRATGLTDAEIYKLFFLRFGIDMLSAQALGRPDAIELADRINFAIGRCAT